MDDTTASIVRSTDFDSTKVFFSVKKMHELKIKEKSIQSTNAQKLLKNEHAGTKLVKDSYISQNEEILDLKESDKNSTHKNHVKLEDEEFKISASQLDKVGILENNVPDREEIVVLNCATSITDDCPPSNITNAVEISDIEVKAKQENYNDQLQPRTSKCSEDFNSNLTTPLSGGNHDGKTKISTTSRFEIEKNNPFDSPDSAIRNKGLARGKVKIPNFETNNYIMGHENYFFKRLSSRDKK